MADVLLRDYVNQLRDHVHAGEHSDVFVLGQHILHYYPKHVETYTLLAQSSLEMNEPANATDLFRRVLSADPENVLALAGMALLAESQDKYDEALWYLERAYEVQPTNDDLRRELLRVRELFYGTAPTRLEMTSGALARVYARQGQYAHAVNEFRRLLRNDSKRFDARVALAETLYRAGRTDEAAQVAQSVMADAPYALKPNLILGALWSENAVPEGQQFLNRAGQLDPEQRVARDLLGEKFADAQPPRIPALGERALASAIDDPSIEVVTGPTYTPDPTSARAAEFLRELERAQEPEPTPEEPLFADMDALSLVGGIAAAGVVAELITGDEPPTGPESILDEPSTAAATATAALGETTTAADGAPADDSSLPIAPVVIAAAAADALADQAQPNASPAEPKPSELPTRGKRSRTPDADPTAIAAAATALAASIALDKSNQPAPTVRSFSVIPKVRPVIRGAADKLPSWLRLGATAAAASAAFDSDSGTSAAGAAVVAASEDRPAWLIEAQEAAERDAQAPQSDNALPDWLKTADTTLAPPPAAAPAAATLPVWLKSDEVAPQPAANDSDHLLAKTAALGAVAVGVGRAVTDDTPTPTQAAEPIASQPTDVVALSDQTPAAETDIAAQAAAEDTSAPDASPNAAAIVGTAVAAGIASNALDNARADQPSVVDQTPDTADQVEPSPITAQPVADQETDKPNLAAVVGTVAAAGIAAEAPNRAGDVPSAIADQTGLSSAEMDSPIAEAAPRTDQLQQNEVSAQPIASTVADAPNVAAVVGAAAVAGIAAEAVDRAQEASSAPVSESASTDELAPSPVESAAQIAATAAVTAAAVDAALPTDTQPPTTEPKPSATDRGLTQQLQSIPDSATVLQMAHERRDEGDIKGALELYERTMHRRPNHLDLIIVDLQEIIRAGDAPTTANRLLGEAYAMSGRFKESLEQYRIAMGK